MGLHHRRARSVAGRGRGGVLVPAGANGVRTALTRSDSTIAAVTAWALYAIAAKKKHLAAIGTAFGDREVGIFDTAAKGFAAVCLGAAMYIPFREILRLRR